MFEEMNKIALSGKEYPIKCDLVVLEKIQEKYGDIGKFEDGLLTWEPVLDENGNQIIENGKKKAVGKFPDVKTVNDALFWMASEGETIASLEEGRKKETIEKETLLRNADMHLIDLANALHNEFLRCFERKNGTTTQNQTEEMEETKE